MPEILTRRSFFAGLGAALAAPAVIRSGILMPLRGIVMPALPRVAGLPLCVLHRWVQADLIPLFDAALLAQMRIVESEMIPL